MRKSIVCAVAFVAVSFLFAGPAPASAQEYVLEMGTVVPGGSPWALQLERLKKYIQDEDRRPRESEAAPRRLE